MPKPSRYVSKSQLETFTSCPRKWGFDKLDGIRYPKPAAILGNAVHDVLEEYVRNGTLPDQQPAPPQGRHRIDPRTVANRVLHLAPKPFTGICEDEINFTDEAGITFYGFADWHNYVDDEAPRLDLVDYKTTSAMRYAHTTNTLWSDVQAAIYGRALMEWYDVDSVWLRWLYVSTQQDTKTTKEVEVELSYDDVMRGWQPITDASREIYRTRDRYTSAKQLPQNLGHCKAYGGCDYTQICLTPAQGFDMFDQEDNTVPLSRLVESARERNEEKDAMTMQHLLSNNAQQAGREVGEPPPELVQPPSVSDVAVANADPMALLRQPQQYKPPAPHPSTGTPLLQQAPTASTNGPALLSQQPAAPAAPAAPTATAGTTLLTGGEPQRPPVPATMRLGPSQPTQPATTATLNINAPETESTDAFDASKVQEQIDKLKADVKKAKAAGAKAAREGTALILAHAVQGLGPDAGFKACDWWLSRFSKEDAP